MRVARSLLLGLTTACAPAPGDESASESDEAASETSETTSDTDTDTDTDSDTTDTGDENLFLSDQFLNIAHRGGALLRPEATLLAFEHAMVVGADVLEMDVHSTADGVIVVIHDDTVDRTTDGSGAVSDMTFAELRMLDAGHDFSADGGQTFPYRGMGIVVPSLDEVLAAFPDRYYLLEIKQSEPPIVDAVLAILADHAVEERVVLASFDDATIETVRTANPSLFTAMSAAEMAEFLQMLDSPDYQPPCRFLQSPWDISSQEFIDRAHALGMKVHPWTVNTSAAMSDMIGRGVDGLMTDDPALLEQVAG